MKSTISWVWRGTHSQWRRLRERKGAKIVLSIVAVLVLARVALPFVLQAYVNHKLDELPEYAGRIGDVHVYLLRGAYAIDNVTIEKQLETILEPFFWAERVDFSLDWSELFRHGVLVSEFEARKSKIWQRWRNPRDRFRCGPSNGAR